MGVYSEKVIAEVNEQLDPRAVLELIGYHTDKLQESAETFRGFCPIHRETVFRTLIIDKSKRTFRCMYSLCKGAAGGTLVELYALAKELSLENALEELVAHFQLNVQLPVDPEYLEKQAEVGENYLELGYLDEAEKVFLDIVAADAVFERAIRGLIHVYEQRGESESLGRQHAALAQILIQRGERSAAEEHVRAWAQYLPDDPQSHRYLGDYLVEQGDMESALEEFMMAADLYAAQGKYEEAIEAYTHVDSLQLDLVDVVPHVLQIYEQMEQPQKAVQFLRERAEAAVLRADFVRAAQLLSQALDIAPDDTALRLRFCEVAILADAGGDWLPQVYSAAESFVEAGHGEEAAQIYQRILDAQPANEEALAHLADLYTKLGKKEEKVALRVRSARLAFENKDYKRAQRDLDAILKELPDYIPALELLADIHLARGKKEQASEVITRVARTLRQRQDFSRAVATYDRVLELTPDNREVQIERAETLDEWGVAGNVRARQQAAREFEQIADALAASDLTRAAQLYAKAEACAPPTGQLLLKRARCLAQLGDINEARDQLSRACDELVATGDVDAAVSGAMEIVKLAPESLDLQLYLINLLEMAGRTKDAVERAMEFADTAAQRGNKAQLLEYLNRALSIDADYIPAIEALALYYHGEGDINAYCEVLLRLAGANEQQGNLAGAVAALERLVDVRPDDVMALGKLAQLYLKLGNRAKSRTCRLQIAELHHRRGALESEKEILLDLLKEDPHDDEILQALIECEFGLGNNEEASKWVVQLAQVQSSRGFASAARQTLERALERNPDDLAVNRMLFELLRQTGNLEEAVSRGLHLADLYHLYDQIDQAVEVFEQISECAPDDLNLIRKQINFLREIGRASEAQERLFASARRLRALGKFAEAEQALLELIGERKADVSELEELLTLYEQWGKTDEFSARAIELARIYESRSEGKKALTLLRRALKVTNGYLPLRRQLAELYQEQGRLADAVRELLQVADVYHAQGNIEDECEVLRQAVSLVPVDRQLRLRLVAVLEEKGDSAAAAAQLEDLAAALITHKRYEEALGILDEVIEKYPQKLSARRIRAEVYEVLGDAKRAEEDLNTFYVQSLLLQAEQYAKQNDIARQAATLREALKIRPKDERLLRMTLEAEYQAGETDAAAATALELVDVLDAEGKRREAEEILLQAAERASANRAIIEKLYAFSCEAKDWPKAVEYGKRLAENLLTSGDKARAISVFEKTVKLLPRDESLVLDFVAFLELAGEKDKALERLLELARQTLQHGELDRAYKHFTHALSIDSLSQPAYEGLAEIAARREDRESQIEWLSKLADVSELHEDFTKTEESLRKIMELSPTDASFQRRLVDVLKRLNRPQDTAKELRRLAEIYLEAEELDSALTAAEEALSLAPEDEEALRLSARLLAKKGVLAEAVNRLEKLAGIYSSHGNFAAALEALEEARRILPSRLSVRKLKAELLEKMGQAEEAQEERRQFEVALALQEADAAREQADFAAEEQALKRALGVAPHDENVWQLLIQCERNWGKIDRAIEAACAYADILKEKGLPERAAEVLEELLESYPDSVPLLRKRLALALEAQNADSVRQVGEKLARTLEASGDIDGALDVRDQLLAHLSHDVKLRLDVAEFCARVARPTEALQRLLAGADLLAKEGQMEEAEALLLHALRLKPKAIECLQRLVQVYERAGRTAEFEQRMLELAVAYDETGLSTEAVTTARRLTLVSPENLEARQLLVRLLRAAGQEHGALEEQIALVQLLLQAGRVSDAVEGAREAVAMSEGAERARRVLAECLLTAGDTEAADSECEELAKIYVAAGDLESAQRVLDEIVERSPHRVSARIQRAELFAQKGDAQAALEEYRLISSLMATTTSRPEVPAPAPSIASLQIVPEYDFEHFVVGTNNNFAYATALAVARAPAQAYNPLFIYSDVGLGKTHLVNAIANHVLRENPHCRIIYTNSEDFTAEVVDAIQTNTINQFRAKYKSVDLLIVDDVQFLAGKERAQEEFFHIFNALFQAKKQIVITSDRPPKDIARLENRLLSRFGAGVIVDIAPPDLETRIAILNREIERGNLDIPPDIVELLAEHIDTNVRELKGALNQVMALKTIRGMEINKDNVLQMLESLYSRSGRESAKNKKGKSEN